MEGQPGTVRISPQVLATIARLTTLSVPGVLSMSSDLPGGLERWFKGRSGSGDGVRVEVVDDAVSVEVHIIAARNVNLYELGLKIQTLVSRAIQDMVGMPVLAVNVHVEDVQIGPAGG
ncbi:MAG: Asp23/Gls24 family envelope stress response protein [Anaerolineae bacterium]|nr:Asp23/Gls24 family envelope stress response protein [Anaerolineae bacterium]